MRNVPVFQLDAPVITLDQTRPTPSGRPMPKPKTLPVSVARQEQDLTPKQIGAPSFVLRSVIQVIDGYHTGTNTVLQSVGSSTSMRRSELIPPAGQQTQSQVKFRRPGKGALSAPKPAGTQTQEQPPLHNPLSKSAEAAVAFESVYPGASKKDSAPSKVFHILTMYKQEFGLIEFIGRVSWTVKARQAILLLQTQHIPSKPPNLHLQSAPA